jgi:CCR4-NOT transcription complex subunit 2
VTGIPAEMLNDQFGMAGLLTCLRAIENDPKIVALALGHDLTTLGLNLNAPEYVIIIISCFRFVTRKYSNTYIIY